MKKRKIYEVSVINKTYSKTYSDQAKFYTSDTALELNFQLKEVEYDFDSAEIILLNVDDRSLVTRPVTKNADGFIYELEDDIVTHYGEWKGQLKFNESGEIYVSSPVGFRIENDLDNDMPPQLTEVNTWKNLRAIADGLIADIRSELELVAVKVSEIEGIESQRQQAEIQREFAESSRVSAEEQRKTDHTNRSAELAGKADKVVLKNELINPTFSEGIEGWKQSVGNSVVINGNEVTVTTTYNGRLGLYQSYDKEGLKYISAEFYSEDTTASFNLGNTGVITTIPNNAWTRVSSVNSATGLIRFYADSGLDNHYIIRNPIIINLTESFGAGNEPTKEEMDELIKVTGYIDGEHTLNSKDIMGHLMNDIREKADKKQEDWLYPTIANGTADASSTPSFYKDEFGVVHLSGKINDLAGTRLTLFTLPTGYRPNTSEGYSVVTGGGSFGYVSINTTGSVTMITGNVAYMLISGITFKAER